MKSTKYSFFIGWIIWSIAAIFYGLDYFQHTAPSVLIKPISEGMGVGIEDIAYIMSIYFPIYAISQIPAGMLLDKFGSKIMLSISCLVMSFGILFFIYDPTLNTMFIGRVLIAIGSAVAFIGTLKVAADVLSQNLFPIAVGFTNTIGVLGGIFGQVYLYNLVEDYGWQTALSFIGYFGIFWSVVIILFLKYSAKNNASKVSSNYLSFGESLKLLSNKKLWLLAIYAGIMVGIVVNSFSELYDVLFLEQVYKVQEQVAANISIMMFIGIAVGGPSHGFIARLFGEMRIWMLICNIITLITFSTVILAADIIPSDYLYILFFLIGFSVSSMLLAFSVVEEIFPMQVKATALAIVNMVIGLCGAVFQYLISIISVYVNNGPLTGTINENVFDKSFVYLLLPLLCSTIIIFILVLEKKRSRLNST
jgi:MFS family permease